MKNNTNYTEEKIKEAKRIIDRTNNTEDVTGYIVDISYNYKYSKIKSIDIKLKNNKKNAEVYVVDSKRKVLVAFIENLDSAKFDKVLNGSIKIIPANMSLLMNDFNDLFTIKIDNNADDIDKIYYMDMDMDLKTILRLYDEFITHYDNYKEFNDLTFYCSKAINYLDPDSLFMFNKYYEKHGNTAEAISEYYRDIVHIWKKLPKRYKPVNYKSLEDLMIFKSRLANSLRSIYTAGIEDYEKRIKEIDLLDLTNI